MKEMMFEFEVNLQHVNHRSQRCFMAKITKEPRIRQDLILAYQLKELIEQGKGITLKQIAGWLGITYERVLQIMALLLLAPKIQEEIIFSEEIKIYRLSERKIRATTKETIWDKQFRAWQKY
jgi:ABC-type multidrug transport system permease subunit